MRAWWKFVVIGLLVVSLGLIHDRQQEPLQVSVPAQEGLWQPDNGFVIWLSPAAGSHGSGRFVFHTTTWTTPQP